MLAAAAAGQAHDPLACKEQLPHTRAGVDQRPSSDGSECSTEAAYPVDSSRPDAAAPPRKRHSLVLEPAVAEAAPEAEALRLLCKPPKGSKRSRATRASTPSPPVSEGSATSTGPEDSTSASTSRAPKRPLSRGQEGGLYKEGGREGAKGDPKGRRASQPWTAEEDDMLRRAVIEVGPQRCSNPNPNPSPNPDPDPGPNPNPNPDHNPDPNQVGPKRWSAIALAVHGRSGKQCRLRWCNQIDPDIKHESWTDKEDATIIRACRRAVHTPAARRSSGQGRPWSWRGLGLPWSWRVACPGLGACSRAALAGGEALERVLCACWMACWMACCSPQAQGTGQPLDGDLEAHPGPDGQRDQEPVERHAEPQGRGAG